MKPWTIKRILEWTAQDLQGRGIASARLDAEVLLAHVLGVDRLGLYLDLQRPLDDEERARFREMVARRREREPVAYLTGTKEFWSSSFSVDRDTLIPRPDTEVLVEEALQILPTEGTGFRAVDVGSGSGCIGISLLKERPELRLLAIDLNPRAATLTRKNADALGVGDRIVVTVGDLLTSVGPTVDLVVSNLPYIPSKQLDSLEPEISQWEPRRALDGGADGLDLFHRLLRQAAAIVAPGGGLALEVGHDNQAEQVVALLAGDWTLKHIRKDYSGAQRVVVAHRSS